MPTNKQLMFFNKNGYPYSFELNQDNTYTGKLLFDENSSDTFKTLGIYVFEEVSPFTVNDNFKLNKMEIYNNSGISFQPATNSGDTIENIARVNSSDIFYSKWIYGYRFDDKYPKGTLISFSGVSFINSITSNPIQTTDFNNTYYTVLDNKPGAILINTKTPNNLWSNYSFVTGNTTITSHNIMTVNDYDKTLYNTVNSWTLHDNKKFSIVGTDYNDSVNMFKNLSSGATIYQKYDVSSVTALIGDILKIDFELKTERPKLYQGTVNFNLSGNTAILTFSKKFNSNINIEENQSMIFETYNDEPILPTNPIFTILDGTIDVEAYNGGIQFIEEINVNKTFMRHFDNKSLSSQAFVNNTTPTFFEENMASFISNYPKTFFEYDYYIQLTGSTTDFSYDLKAGDTIKLLSGSTVSSGSTRAKNINRTFTILDVKTFQDIRVDYWKGKIRTNKSWYDKVVQTSIEKLITIESQLEIEAINMYDTQDNNVLFSGYITDRYEKIKVKEYILEETILNNYTIQKILKPEQINTISCSMTVSVPYPTSFEMNVVAYDTSNILSFTQEILPLNSSDMVLYKEDRLDYWKNTILINSSLYTQIAISATGSSNYIIDPSGTIESYINDYALTLYTLNDTNSGISYTNTLNAFNLIYGDYLYDNYGIIVYKSSATTEINIHSIYSLNLDSSAITYDRYFVPNLYLNNVNLSATTGIINSQVNNVLLEFDNTFISERVLPNEFDKFDKCHYLEIYFNLSNNETNFGFNLEINDQDYYIAFDEDTQTTINSFIDKYSYSFQNNFLTLSSGTTILSETGTSGYTQYYQTGYTWVDYDTRVINSGYTLKISAAFSNVEIRTIKPKVNLYSEYKIISSIENKFLLLSGNELELSNTNSLYDYGFSTGMILSLSGSQYIQNNVSYNIIGLTESVIELSYQGLFYNDSATNLKLDIDRYLRKPRESVNKDVYYNWKFVENVDGKFTEDIFFYDVTGEHLTPYLNDPKLSYIGPKPLWDTTQVCSDRNKNIHLIDEPNKKIEFISDPTKQQTVFRGTDGEYCLKFLLDQYDSTTEYNYVPEPLQVFLGFNSKNEGVSNANIILEKVENIIFSGYTSSNNVDFNFGSTGLLEIISNNINFNFIDYGFETDQPITIDFVDQSISGTTTFKNYGTFTIDSVGGKKMKLKNNYRNFKYFSDDYIPFTTSGKTDGFYYEIKVQPSPILNLSVYGETETEDERFRIVLNNLGVQINEDTEHLFIDSDINEDGIDYIRLNQKRKEMLLVYPEIYNYVGSYKSLINAINFFGWNDLQLFEYYKNIDPASPLYQKLQKVLIPDIFDNTVEGWTTNDYVSGKYKTGLVKKTNLFNLTYKITDEEGNNVIVYSLDEVQIKLNKLKRWLKRNILPLSTNIVDITGVADVEAMIYQQYDVSNQTIKAHCETETTAVNFVYTQTLNFKDGYLFEIEFYTLNNVIPSGWTCKIKTFSVSTDGTNKLIPQKYFKLMKNDLGNFSFNIDKNIDQFLYIETSAYNDYGVGQTYDKMINTSTSKNYLLVNNRFHIPNYNYLNVGEQYYWFDEQRHIYFED